MITRIMIEVKPPSPVKSNESEIIQLQNFKYSWLELKIFFHPKLSCW